MRNRIADLAALVLRVVTGLVFIPHGYSKVFGAGGPGAFAADMPGLGIPSALGYVAAYAEFFGAVLMIAGLLTRLDAFLLGCTMFVAAFFVQLKDALYEVPAGSSKFLAGIQGMELPLMLFGACVTIVLLGAGRYSLDALLKTDERVASLVKRKP